ncbi:MAG: hypothetical protein LUE29_03085, partial [Lachnospiraceae bacterium]|nr:hypothetical protein [Lachnospiraceae bacterium]
MIQLNKLIRSVLAFSVALAILLCTPLTGFAFPGKFPDTNRTGSITLTLKDSDGNIVAGGEISLYEVASLKIESGSAAYVLTDEFENCTVTLNVTDTSLAGILAQYVEDYHVSGTSEILGSDGTVKFDSLELGLYLVVQTVISDDGQTFNPFVVTVPFEVDGEWEYEVDASPKPALVSFTDDQETEGSEETTNPEETTDTEEST